MVNKSDSETIKKNLNQLGEFLKELRINNGMTQQELATEYDISRSLIQRVERGDNIHIQTLLRVTIALNIKLSQLFQMLDN